jgi:hypothetical protein
MLSQGDASGGAARRTVYFPMFGKCEAGGLYRTETGRGKREKDRLSIVLLLKFRIH